jgi:hypothetical protein
MDGECSTCRKIRNEYKILTIKPENVDGRTILKWISRKSDVGVWTVFNWLGIGSSGGLL